MMQHGAFLKAFDIGTILMALLAALSFRN